MDFIIEERNRDSRLGKQLEKPRPQCLECRSYLNEDIYRFREDDDKDKYIWICLNCGSVFRRILEE